MYLDNGREIYECDKFPGYYIDADTGNFCDEEGNLVGGNIDNGEEPGHNSIMLIVPDLVFISKRGKQYYPSPTKRATIAIPLDTAHKKGMIPSISYNKFVERLYKKYLHKMSKKKK